MSIVCPKCGEELIDIVYGFPAPEVIEKAERGEIYLGGCIITENQVLYHCNHCNRNYDKDLEHWEDISMKHFEPKKITKEDFLKIDEDNLMFITNPGRMGDEDGSTFIVRNGNELSIYRVDGWMYPSREKGKILMGDAEKQFPKWRETWKHCNDKDYKGKYKYIYMGFGNGLSVDYSIYSDFEPYLNQLVESYLEKEDDKESLQYAAIYNVWMDAFMEMVHDKKYVIK